MTRTAPVSTELQRAESFATLFLLSQLLSRLGDEVLAPLELTTKQWLLLAVVAKGFADTEPTLSEVATLYGSSRQNIKQIAQQLEARGWLHLVNDPADRRAVRLQLTRKMQRFASPAFRAREHALFDRIFGALPASELAQLHRSLVGWRRSLTDS